MEQEILFQGIRTLFIVTLPILLVTSLAGLLASVFQTSTALHEPIISYVLKLLSVVLLLYFMLPQFIRTIISLTQSAFGL
ncbi:MAG: flagellar biosynthetic protein FliQ [Bdellovibrionales bacterium]|nr:flagellar biosynthetic protein FliQ [Bdellovibrionales bacterium]